jgi:ABC-type sugar transport system permease subunit
MNGQGEGRTTSVADGRDAGSAWLFLAPALLVIALVAVFPIGWTLWESLHRHDLRMPWLGRPFVGLRNYQEIVGDSRFWSALVHTVFFAVSTTALEVLAGIALALLLNRPTRGRGPLRVVMLLPWALPTVVVALLWRFMFEGQSGVANTLLERMGMIDAPRSWFVGATSAWVPIILADVWRMTPFVALLLLAGLQQIDPSLYEAARMDGAGAWSRFREVTLPLLRPALLVAILFRALDAFRVFDAIFVMTGGGPGTATEPLSLYAFNALLQNLRFGFGSALSIVVFAASFLGALAWIRLLGSSALVGVRT